MMEILLLRHARTKGNQEGRYVGRTDEPILIEEIEKLKNSKYAMYHPDFVYCSPLLRCIQTAKLMFFADGKIEKMKIQTGLEETDFGEFEYRNYAELNGDPAYQAWIDSGGMLAFPGGESGKDFRDRSCRAFLDCVTDAEKQKAEKIAVVAHGGTIMAVMEAFGKPESDFYSWQVKNGEGFLTRLIYDEHRKPVLEVLPLQEV